MHDVMAGDAQGLEVAGQLVAESFAGEVVGLTGVAGAASALADAVGSRETFITAAGPGVGRVVVSVVG